MVKKCIAQNFKRIFEIFTIYRDLNMNIMGIKTKNAQSIFREKVSVEHILHIMSSKMLYGYTDTVLS